MGPATQQQAIRSSWLRVPKGLIQPQIIRGLCSYTYANDQTIQDYEEVNGQWLLPRELFEQEHLDWLKLDTQWVGPRCRPAFYATTGQVSPSGAPTERQQVLQQQALDCLTENQGGVVQLPPGTGKTAIGLALMQHYGLPTIVVSHKSLLQKQWADRAHELMGLPQDRILFLGGRGRKRPSAEELHEQLKGTDLLLATVQTLCKYPKLQYIIGLWSGLALYDEVHHMQASKYRQALDVCSWYRVGLSATVEVDGLEHIFLNHLGPVVLRCMKTDLVPTVVHVRVHKDLSPQAYVRITRPIFLSKDKVQELRAAARTESEFMKMTSAFRAERGWQAQMSRTMNELADFAPLTQAIVACAQRLAKEGRKQLLLSNRLAQLHALKQAFGDTASLLTSETPVEEQKKALYDKDIVCASSQIAQEGLDRPELDTLHVCLPWSGRRPFIQGTGRILRHTDDKQPPEIYLYDVRGVRTTVRMCKSFLRHARRYRYPIKQLDV